MAQDDRHLSDAAHACMAAYLQISPADLAWDFFPEKVRRDWMNAVRAAMDAYRKSLAEEMESPDWLGNLAKASERIMRDGRGSVQAIETASDAGIFPASRCEPGDDGGMCSCD